MAAFLIGALVGMLGCWLVAAAAKALGCAHDATSLLRSLCVTSRQGVVIGEAVLSLWWCRKCRREWAERDDGSGARPVNVPYALGMITEASREEWVAKKAAHAAAGARQAAVR